MLTRNAIGSYLPRISLLVRFACACISRCERGNYGGYKEKRLDVAPKVRHVLSGFAKDSWPGHPSREIVLPRSRSSLLIICCRF